MRKRTLPIVVAALLATACGAARTASGPVPRPRPFPGAPLPPTARTPIAEPRTANADPNSEAATTNRAPGTEHRELLSTALNLQGTPYRNGGSDPSGFDCSGFVQWVYSRHGTALPREVRDQWRVGEDVDRDDVEAGDLVFFETVSRGTVSASSRQTATHVGIALGGDQFVHAPSSTGVVRIERFSATYWSSRWVGARRVLRRDEATLAQ